MFATGETLNEFTHHVSISFHKTQYMQVHPEIYFLEVPRKFEKLIIM